MRGACRQLSGRLRWEISSQKHYICFTLVNNSEIQVWSIQSSKRVRMQGTLGRVSFLVGLKDLNLYNVLTVSKKGGIKRCDMPAAIKQK